MLKFKEMLNFIFIFIVLWACLLAVPSHEKPDGQTKIVGKYLKLREPLRVEGGEKLQIINSTLDFTCLRKKVRSLIVNNGMLLIKNSTIISNLKYDGQKLIENRGSLTLVYSKIVNSKPPVNLETKQVNYIFAVISQAPSKVKIYGNYIENFANALRLNFIQDSIIYNNTFKNCPTGITLEGVRNVNVSGNKLTNSIAVGVRVVNGAYVEIRNNFIYNRRDLMQVKSTPFIITEGVSIVKGKHIHVVNNTILNTYHSVAISDSKYVLVKNNYISTTDKPKVGEEIYTERSTNIIFEGNIIFNQTDSIEIYNSQDIVIRKNYIENGNSAVRIVYIESIGGEMPSNITIYNNTFVNNTIMDIQSRDMNLEYNAIVNTNVDLHGALNIKFYRNTFKHAQIALREEASNVSFINNTIIDSSINIISARDVVIEYNVLNNARIYHERNENIVIKNNELISRKEKEEPEEVERSPLHVELIKVEAFPEALTLRLKEQGIVNFTFSNCFKEQVQIYGYRVVARSPEGFVVNMGEYALDITVPPGYSRVWSCPTSLDLGVALRSLSSGYSIAFLYFIFYVKTTSGYRDTVNATITVNIDAAPAVNIENVSVHGLEVIVYGNATPGRPGLPVYVAWNWGDGSSDRVGFPANHVYSKPGNYTITITAYQSDGRYTTKTITVSLSGGEGGPNLVPYAVVATLVVLAIVVASKRRPPGP